MQNMRWLAAASAALMMIMSSVTAAFADEPPALAGTEWWTPGEESRVVFSMAEDGTLEGRFSWLKRDEDLGVVSRDTNNKDEALRERAILGMAFVYGFEAKRARWVNGTIYDPRNGEEYKSIIAAGESDDSLAVKGCVGFGPAKICRDNIWTRYSAADS